MITWSDESGELWGIVVAGGSGARFGQRKQLLELVGERVLDRAIAALRPFVSATVAVLPADAAAAEPATDGVIVVAGGASRSASVRAGLAALPGSATHVLIHDAARPLADRALVQRVVDALSDSEAVVPVVPVTDTLRLRIGGPADRDAFVAVQTPQGFALSALRKAHADGGEASDDATLIDDFGGRVVHVEGDPSNIKITSPHDLVVAEALITMRSIQSSERSIR